MIPLPVCINGSTEETNPDSGFRSCSSRWFSHDSAVSVEFCNRCQWRNRRNEDMAVVLAAFHAEHHKAFTRRQRVRAWLFRLVQRVSSGGYPSMAQQLLNFGLAGLKHVANGMAEVPEATFRMRLEICHGCPSGEYDAGQKRCRACGCGVDSRAFANKLRWASESCPRGHWGREDNG
jgi:hypothetical protein